MEWVRLRAATWPYPILNALQQQSTIHVHLAIASFASFALLLWCIPAFLLPSWAADSFLHAFLHAMAGSANGAPGEQKGAMGGKYREGTGGHGPSETSGHGEVEKDA